MECIKKYSKLADRDPSSVCGESISKNAKCYNSYESLYLCLINNECHNSDEEKPVSYMIFRSMLSAGIAGMIC